MQRGVPAWGQGRETPTPRERAGARDREQERAREQEREKVRESQGQGGGGSCVNWMRKNGAMLGGRMSGGGGELLNHDIASGSIDVYSSNCKSGI
jgi:hypothetical protein